MAADFVDGLEVGTEKKNTNLRPVFSDLQKQSITLCPIPFLSHEVVRRKARDCRDFSFCFMQPLRVPFRECIPHGSDGSDGFFTVISFLGLP